MTAILPLIRPMEWVGLFAFLMMSLGGVYRGKDPTFSVFVFAMAGVMLGGKVRQLRGTGFG